MTPIAFQTDLDAQNRTIGSDVNRNGMPVVTDAIVPTRVDPLATTVKIMRGKDKLEPAPPTPPEQPIAIAPLQEPIAIASPSKKLNAAAATEAAKEMLDIRRGAVYQSALRSSSENPDAAAKALKAARDSGTSYDFVLQNMEQTQRRLFGREVAKLDLPKNAPVLAEKLATDPDFARVANDDLANLKEQEGWFSWFGHQVTGIPTAFMHGFAGYEHAESGAMQVFGPSPLHPTMWSMADPQTFENRNAQLNAQELTFDPENEGGWLPVFNMLGQTAYQFARAVPAAGGGAIVGGLTGLTMGVSPLPWQKAATPVTTLVGAQLGAKAGFSAALIEDQVRQAAGMMYNRMIDEGVDPNVARWKAASWGLALGGIQVGLMKVLYPKIATSILETEASKAAADKLLAKKLAAAIADPSMKGAVKRISAQTAKTTAKTLGSVGGMVIMFEAANEDARRASNLPMRSASPEGRAELIDIAVNNFKFMATGAVGMHVLMPSAHNPIMELGRERSRIRAAEKQAEGFETLSILQKASKLAVRSPEDAQSLMEGTLTGTPIEDILISKEGIQRAMATLKIPMAKLDEVIPGALAQFNDVASGTAESGGYIKVKTADFKARIEKTPLGSLLLGDVTWSAEIGTLRESAARSAFLKTFISEINENVEKFADEVNEAINKDDANRESAEKVANVIEAQLIGEGRTAEQARTESRFLGAIAFAGAARESEGKATRMTPEEFHRKYPIHIAERESEKPSEPAREVAAPTETAAQVKPVVPTTVDPTSRPRTVAEMLVENRRAEEAKANEPVGQMSRQGNDAIVEAIANLREANEAHKGFAKDEGSTAKTASMHEMMSDQIAAVEREVKAGDAVGLEIEIAILQEMLRAGNIREARNAVKQPGIAKQLATTAQRLIDTARDELDRIIESTPKTGEEGALNQEPAVRKRDVEYKAAVERGDTETAQQMVNDAARDAGYTVGPVYHGTKRAFTTFKGSIRDSSDLSYFSFNKEFAEKWPRGSGGNREPSPEIRARIDAAKAASRELTTPLWEKLLEKYGAWDKMPDEETDAIWNQRDTFERSMLDGMTVAEADSNMGIRVINGFLRAENVFNPRENWREFIPQILKVFDKQSIEELTESEMQAVTEGNYLVWENREVVDAVLSRYDAIRLQESRVDGNLDTIAIRDPSRIKSSDPITRDEQGNVIPLSERFNPESDNFLYQPLRVALPTAAGMLVNPTDLVLPTISAALPKDTQTAIVQKRVAAAFSNNVEVFDKKEVDVKGEKVPTYGSIIVTGTTPEERAQSIVNQMARNLLSLYSLIPERIRARTILWYDGANTISRSWTERYRVSADTLGAWDKFKTLEPHHVAGVIAVYSPQMAWQTNLSLAERTLDILAFRRNFLWSEKMSAWADEYAKTEDSKFVDALEKIRGVALKDVDAKDYWAQAIWVRAFDEAHHDKGHRDVSPEGRVLDMLKTAKNADASVHWGPFSTIAKAIRIATEQSIDSVHEGIGNAHKVRSFYNNIVEPNHELPFFTSDTHQVAANLLLPVAGNDIEVAHNFGAGGSSSNSVTGLQGTYFLHVEAGARAADLVGIMPRQMQSATWEVIRAIFSDTFKSNKANKELVRGLWAKYISGETSYEQTFTSIVRAAGGYQEPSWAKHGSDYGVATQEREGSTYRADVPRPQRFDIPKQQPRDGVLVGANVPRPDRQREFSPERFERRIKANEGNRGSQRDDAIRFARHQSATSLVDEHGYSQRDRRADDVGTGLLEGIKIKAVYEAGSGLVKAFELGGMKAPSFFEIDATGADQFAQAISNSKAATKFGAAVLVYPVEEYRNMRLFMSQDGKSGFALKPDGDIVSVFSSGDAKAGMAALQLAIKLGGSKLDAFDTALPKMYAPHGFKVVARLKWDEQQAPIGWDKKTFSEFNNGEPDVVFMALDPNSFDSYRTGEGEYAKNYEDALQKQDKSLGLTVDQDANISKQESGVLEQAAPASPKFKNWFKDSKVVDENGSPLVVHHGSGQRQQIFRGNLYRSLTKSEQKELAENGQQFKGSFFFTTKKSLAETYMPPKETTFQITDEDGFQYEGELSRARAEKIKSIDFPNEDNIKVSSSTTQPNTRSFFLSVQNPLVVEANGRSWNQLTSKDLPKSISDRMKSTGETLGLNALGDGPTSQILRLAEESGYDGVLFRSIIDLGPQAKEPKNMSAAEKAAAVSDVWGVGDSRQIKSTENKGGYNPEVGSTLYQAASKKPARASFNPKTFEVKLGHHSDMTSWVHESSHYLFETYHRMILDGSAPKWVADDFQTLLTFFGVKDNAEWNTLSFEARRKHYEKFSYNFEIYMAEGKAPTIALQPLFDRFKSWIIQVYTDVVKHQNTLYKEQFGEELPPLTDEVRRVMDRMLATEEQIRSTAEARDMKAMFQTQEEAGVSDAAWAEYQTVLGASHRDAVNELTARSMRDFQWVGNMKSKFLKELAKKNAATRRAVRDEVEEQVRAEPIFRAIDFLKYGMTTSENGERVLAENVGKLNLADAKAVLGDEAAKLGYGKYGMIAKDGMPADLVAELFGFKSGDELLRALAAAKKVGDEIDARTDERMMKEFGDLNDPERMEQAANAALHNDARARAVATELNFITKATTPVKEMVAAAREAAVDHINNRKIKDVKAHEFAVAEAKAARAARSTADSKVNPEAIGKSAGTRAYNKAIANGVDEAAAVKLGEDAATTAAANAQERINLHKKQYGDVDPMESARRAKQHQLFNNQLAAVAGEVQEEVRDTVKSFSKFFKADSKIGKSRDIEMVMAARSILSAFGFGRSDKAPIDYVKQIEAFNPELFAGLEPIIARASRGAQDYRELTVAEFRALSDGVTALWNDARRDKQIMVGDKKVALAQVVGELVDRTTELGVPTEMAGDKSAPTQRQRMMRTLNGVKNMMRRVEHWCDAMDGLGNTGGPFTKYIFRPIVDAMDAYRADRTKYLKRYAELCATIELPKGRIAAPELDYTFGVGNGGIGKSELLGALLHMGNDSNMRKLLIGRKWGELDAEGNLDASRMMKFINRMVTEGKLVKADFDFVQSVWDLNEELKPMSQKSHRDLYGFYFKEVEATPLNTPFGTYRGGYVPAKADPFMVKDAQRHAKMDALEGNFNQVMPSTGLGFTQPRVEYNRPLALDLRMIGKHIDDVIRFAHVQPAIKDVLKVIGNEEFASALSKIDPTAIETMLIPFLGRAARHTAVEQGRFKAVDDFWIAVRGRTSLMFMSLNLRQLGDVGGISVALTKVKRGQLAAAMKQYLDSPHEVATMIAEASPMMDERLSNHINDTRARLDDLIGDQSGLGKAQALARKHGMFLNTVLHNQLDIVTWLGAYNQALAEIAASAGDKEAQREAVSRADAAVRLTQGAMNPEDVAAYEQGTPFYRTITQFTTYLNTLANLNADEYGKIVRELGIRKGAGKLVQAHILAYAVPMIIFGVWTDLISGGWDDDDESWAAHALSVLFGSYFSGGIGMLPFGSQVQGVAEATIAKSIGGSVIRNKEHINVSPSINALEGGVVGAADSAYRAVSGKEITGKNIKDALTLVSLFTGIPLNPIGKTVGYAVDVNNNKIQPTGTADYIRGLITGSASPESRK